MNFRSLRSALVGSAVAALASLLLVSCGGGGASTNNPVGGPVTILPSGGTLYAGVPYTFTFAGGVPPYFLSSSEPSLLAVPQRITGHTLTVIPANPAVIDNNLPPGSLPVRTVVITMRDTAGNTASTLDIKVAQNFFTGYDVFFSSNCPAPTTGDPPQACANGETLVSFTPSINGNRFGNRTYRFEVLRGPFYWVFPGGQVAGNVITLTTNHEGRIEAILRVNPNVPTQFGVMRVTDVETGTSTEQVFFIDGTDIATTLTILPDEVTFTGATNAQCGTGRADFLVFDGTPPYTAVSSFPQVIVTPNTSDSQPGRFTLNASDPFTCLSDATIVVTDANNNRGTVTVNTEAGEDDPPPPPLAVTPTTLTLGCGQSASASVIGGGETISAASASPNVSVAVSGRTVTVTRAGADPSTPPNVSSQVTITDGATSTTLTVVSPTGCS